MQDYSDKKTIFGIILFALSILMLIYMLFNPLNQLIVNVEEYFTLTLIHFPITDIFSMCSGDTNPPLYYLLAKAASKLLGMLNLEFSKIFFLKLLSILPYVLILIISAAKIRKDYGWLTAGLFALSLGVMSEFFTSYLLLRPYSWALLFVVLSFVYFKDIIATNDKNSWILFTVFSILSAYSYYFAGITSICLYLILLGYILKFDKDKLKTWGISLAALIICYVPWILPLMNFLGSIHNNFWIPSPTPDLIIQTLTYFAYSGDTLFSIVIILIAAVIGIVYALNSKDEQTYILSGIGAFILTLIIGLAISFAFQPVLLAKCLLPASGIVWLCISIMISKIENTRMFWISFALIILVLASGAGFLFAQTNELHQTGMNEKAVLDNITSSNDSIVILTTPNMIIHFLDYADRCDMYCIDADYIYGENMDRVHQFFNFKDIGQGEIENLTTANSDKNIYLISWGEPDVGLNTTTLSKENGVVISQVKIPEIESEEEDYYY